MPAAATKQGSPPSAPPVAAAGYRAEQAPDGTWTVFDVPVFAEHVDDRGDPAVAFTRTWLDGALAKAQQRAAEGYLPPLHVQHHSLFGGEVRAAGHFRLTRVGTLREGGRDAATLFADLTRVPAEVYAEVRAGHFPYRSVEIVDLRKGEVDSLALLDHEVPYFRFPLLAIRERAAPSEAAPVRAAAPGPVLYYRAAGDPGADGARPGLAIAFRFQEGSMPGDDKDKGTEKAGEGEGGSDGAVDAAKDALKVAIDALEADAKAVCEALRAKAKELGLDLGAAPAAEAAPDGAAGGPVEAPPAAMSAAGGSPPAIAKAAAAAPSADVLGRLRGLELRFAAREQVAAAAASTDQVVTAAVADLARCGLGSPDVAADLKAVAAAEGAAGVRTYAAALRRHGAATPPPTLEAAEGRDRSGAATGSDAPEVAAYAAAGPAVLADARRYAATFDRLPVALRASGRADFIRHQFGELGDVLALPATADKEE